MDLEGIFDVYGKTRNLGHYPLFDDGLHNDNQTSDGTYANAYGNASLWGIYDVTVTASGILNENQFARETFATVWIEQHPDLILNASDIYFSNDSPSVGDTITINTTIHNIGNADANNASIFFYDGDPTTGELIAEDIINVSASQTAITSVSWNVTAGQHEIYVLISPFNEFLEGNYTNNSASKNIQVGVFIFDTGNGTYPSISGTHNGTIKPNQTIIVSTIYTYPCPGTGGHAEYAKISNQSWSVETVPWNGYVEDWHNLTFDKTFTLHANETYNFTIRTGSYPQIIHNRTLVTENGRINCTEFTDANGKEYDDWIPAVKFFW